VTYVTRSRGVKNDVLRMFCVLVSLVGLNTSADAAHIGDSRIVGIRHYSPKFVVVWLDRQITNPPTCATTLNKTSVALCSFPVVQGLRLVSLAFLQNSTLPIRDDYCTFITFFSTEGCVADLPSDGG